MDNLFSYGGKVYLNTLATARSSLAYARGPVSDTCKCYICGSDTPNGHDFRLNRLSACPDHCEDHEYGRGEIECMHCGEERPFDDEPDYDYSY